MSTFSFSGKQAAFFYDENESGSGFRKPPVSYQVLFYPTASYFSKVIFAFGEGPLLVPLNNFQHFTAAESLAQKL